MPEMTIEAATIELNRLKSQERMDIDRERMIAAVDTLTKAARYRLKQKIVMRSGWDICPHCCEILGNTDERLDLMFLNMPYCKRCGQALDWRNT